MMLPPFVYNLAAAAPHAATAGEHGEHAAPVAKSAWTELASSLDTIVGHGIEIVSLLGMGLVSLCILASLYRILKGPTLTDRILASDALSLFVVALVLLLGEALETAVFFDAALMVAILGFVSTIAMSRFLLTAKDQPQTKPSASPAEVSPAVQPSTDAH